MGSEITITQDEMQKALSDGFSSYLYTKERTGGGDVGNQIPAAIASVIRERLTEDLLRTVVHEAVETFLESHSQEIIKALGKSRPPKRPGEKTSCQNPEELSGSPDG